MSAIHFFLVFPRKEDRGQKIRPKIFDRMSGLKTLYLYFCNWVYFEKLGEVCKEKVKSIRQQVKESGLCKF
jgi:hypothetical protein